MRARGELQEDAVFLQDEALAAGELIILPAEPVCPQPFAISLVSGKALDGVDAVGGGRRAFVRREITDEIGAAGGDRLAPVAGILLEGIPPVRVDLVADEA